MLQEKDTNAPHNLPDPYKQQDYDKGKETPTPYQDVENVPLPLKNKRQTIEDSEDEVKKTVLEIVKIQDAPQFHDEEIEDPDVDLKELEEIEEDISVSLTPESEVSFQKGEGQKIKKSRKDEIYYVDKLPKTQPFLRRLKEKVQYKTRQLKFKFFQETFENMTKKSQISDDAVPICADVRYFDFSSLRDQQIEQTGKLFDVIMMDPPWQLSSSQPSRGVAIAYSSLADDPILKMPVPILQTDGYIFIWTINAKYRSTVRFIKEWGYTLLDEIIWVKRTVNGKIAKGHGYYLQHAKEHCLIGVKGNVDNGHFVKSACSDVIFSQRRGQSQKPEEIYQYIEKLCPSGFYLEIFGRRNNVRKNWVTIGNEL